MILRLKKIAARSGKHGRSIVWEKIYVLRLDFDETREGFNISDLWSRTRPFLTCFTSKLKIHFFSFLKTHLLFLIGGHQKKKGGTIHTLNIFFTTTTSLSFCCSPWYNHTGWLGVEHTPIYTLSVAMITTCWYYIVIRKSEPLKAYLFWRFYAESTSFHSVGTL